MTMQQYCLRWNNHQPNFISVFSSLLNSESLVDVTLAAEGRHLQAHKVVLSACSSYFQSLFTINPCQHPIVILKDVKFVDLKVMIDFMYYGEVNVSQEQLPYILKTAEMLKIKGLAEIPVDQPITKTENNSSELVTQEDHNWAPESIPRQSLTPSPCPLSPISRRKRLRKSSTGSGSGSTEKAPEDAQSEVTMTSGSSMGTVIRSDIGSYGSDSNSMLKNKQHSSDSEFQRGSSYESNEGETKHQITLQVPQQDVSGSSHSHAVENPATSDAPGTSTSSGQHTITGIHWNVLDQTGFAQFTSPTPVCGLPNEQNHTVAGLLNIQQPCPNTETIISQPQSTSYQNQISNSPPQIMQKKKRSINPQADENFVRALEAVRYGGIGFCKAARMYGVNNRTLWLEYKKRGYPNFRLSIKNRKPENQAPVEVEGGANAANVVTSENVTTEQHAGKATTEEKADSEQYFCPPVALTFYDGKHVDFTPVLQRPKFLDGALINTQPTVNYQTINFEQV